MMFMAGLMQLMVRLWPRNTGQSIIHMCERDARAVHFTWSVRLAPVSEDKGQYCKSRGGEGGESSSGFEPVKALVRGLPLLRPPSFRVNVGSYQSYDLSGE